MRFTESIFCESELQIDEPPEKQALKSNYPPISTWAWSKAIMKKITALFTVLALCSSVAVFAGPPKTKKPAVKTAKLTQVWTCPASMERVTDKSAKGTVVGKYNVHFCCADCPGKFAKMSKAEQLAAAEKASKNDKAPAVKKG